MTKDSKAADALVGVIEALLLSSDSALSIEQLIASFDAAEQPDKKAVRDALHKLDEQLTGRAVELREVASGWRVQVRPDYAPYIGRLWEERPPRYSRAMLETLALIVYRQPISRGEIEEIRGVSLSPNIIKTLIEREWVKVVGVREAPGRPELLGTTRTFLDDFNLKSLKELPSLPEIRDIDSLGDALKRLGIDPAELADSEGEETQGDLLQEDEATSGKGEADMQFGEDDGTDLTEGAAAEADLEPETEQNEQDSEAGDEVFQDVKSAQTAQG